MEGRKRDHRAAQRDSDPWRLHFSPGWRMASGWWPWLGVRHLGSVGMGVDQILHLESRALLADGKVVIANHCLVDTGLFTATRP